MEAQTAAPLALNDCQLSALERLKGLENVFLTGVAGSGKSTLVRHFLRNQDPKDFPVLASTGAAAILVGGRTFHSFFGLGILQGGFEATCERALANKRLVRRLKKTRGVVIDEISMLSGVALRAAEYVARVAREKPHAWGGLKVVAVGDFAQLPPVTMNGPRDWGFLDESWNRSRFEPAVLKTIVRTQDREFLDVLNDVRQGQVTPRVRDFLNSRLLPAGQEFEGTRLFPRRDMVENFNLSRLNALPGTARTFETTYTGSDRHIQDLRKVAPVPEVLHLKENALVMLRQNDPQGRWVNGSLGTVAAIADHRLKIALWNGLEIELDKASFTLLDAEGMEVAAATNFPVNLAYATTIHKAQGMTLDKVLADLRNLWEPGQAYVALSRVRSPENLFLSGWTPSSIRMDGAVRDFYDALF